MKIWSLLIFNDFFEGIAAVNISPLRATNLKFVVPSDEQHAIINKLNNGVDLMVNSVAGSGKSTTALLVAKSYPDKQILLLTFNARLKNELRQKVDKWGLLNMEVHNYHAMGCKYYLDECSRDSGLNEIVIKDLHYKQTLPQYDIIVCDEVQDMSPLLYAFVHKILRDLQNCGKIPRLLLIGDARQCIFKFKGADSRYNLAPHSRNMGLINWFLQGFSLWLIDFTRASVVGRSWPWKLHIAWPKTLHSLWTRYTPLPFEWGQYYFTYLGTY